MNLKKYSSTLTSCSYSIIFERRLKFSHFKIPQDFPGGSVVKNPPVNAGDTGLSPGSGRSHMLRSN